MRTIKCESFNRRNGYLDYYVNGVYCWAQGEFYYVSRFVNGAVISRYEHTHVGVRGGSYLIVTPWE